MCVGGEGSEGSVEVEVEGGSSEGLDRQREGRRTAVDVKLEGRKAKCCRLFLSLSLFPLFSYSVCLSLTLFLFGDVCVWWW